MEMGKETRVEGQRIEARQGVCVAERKMVGQGNKGDRY